MRVFRTLDKIIGKISDICTWISGLSLFIIAAVITVDVVMRYLFKNAIKGQQEIAQILMVFVVYFALAYSTRIRAHVRVDILTNVMPPALRNICLGLVTWLCIFVTVNITIRTGSYGLTLMQRGTTTAILKIPYYPFYIIIAVMSVLISIEFFIDGVKYFVEAYQAITHKNTSDPSAADVPVQAEKEVER